MTFQLYDQAGHRKFLTAAERTSFLAAAEHADRSVRTFCMTLAFTGSRISEALHLTADSVDFTGRAILFDSSKKRRTSCRRAVPVPVPVLDFLDLVHGVREAQRARDGGKDVRLWPWGRATAWRRVSEVMHCAGLHGPQASPKGLRHGFGVAAVQAGVPLNMLQKWLGHAQLSTTAIYAAAVDDEEQAIAERMWQ